MLASIKKIIQWCILIGSVFFIGMILKWLGLKGILGLIAGMCIMAYLVISRNMFFVWMIKAMFNEIDLSDITGGKRNHGIKKDQTANG